MVLKMRQPLGLQTRLCNDISNEINRERAQDGVQLAVDRLMQQHPDAIPRTTNPSLKYNCHGLTFGARRTNIGEEGVTTIFKDDEYQEIDRAHVMPGDIAVYRSKENSEVQHSGIVTGEPRASPKRILTSDKATDALVGPWIVSKWGECHEALHRLYDCPYPDAEVKFYRVRT